MSIWSSLFGKQEITPAVGAQPINVTEIPAELKPYYKDILTKAQALYNDRTSQGYQPYTGPTLAEFTPEQQQVQSGIAGLVGTQAPAYQEAMGMTRDASTPFSSEQIEEYMSPYQQAVTDIEKREATKQYQTNVVPQLAAKAAMTQPFGGSRQAILEGMAADTQQRLLGDIQAKGSQSAYQDAISRLDADRLAKGQGASQLANLASSQYKGAATELSQLQLSGEEQQRQNQTALDEAFKQYLEEQQYPYDTMRKYQSMVIGAPLGTTGYSKPQAAVMGPSFGQQLVGGLGGLGNIYGSFTGKTIGGTPYNYAGQLPTGGLQTGGGIGSLIKRKVNGPANNNEDETFKTNFGINYMDAYKNYIENFQGPYSERFKQSEKDLQESNKLMRQDLARDKSYLEADRANQQFHREQAAFTAMAKLGTDPDVTDAPGGGAGQILTMLGKAGPEIGAAETARRANIREQDRAVSKLEIQYKQAMASGNLELANTYMAQLKALSEEYSDYMTAQAADGGFADVTTIPFTDALKGVEHNLTPANVKLLESGAEIKGLNPNIVNPYTDTDIWRQSDIYDWAVKKAFKEIKEIVILEHRTNKSSSMPLEQRINLAIQNNITMLFRNQKPIILNVSEGDPEIVEEKVTIDNNNNNKNKKSTKDVIDLFD